MTRSQKFLDEALCRLPILFVSLQGFPRGRIEIMSPGKYFPLWAAKHLSAPDYIWRQNCSTSQTSTHVHDSAHL